MSYEIVQTALFKKWLSTQTPKTMQIIVKRVANIKFHSHFGLAKNLGHGLSELKFKSGIRIYFTLVELGDKTVFLLLGGNKNGQDKDIKKARTLIQS